MPIAQPYSVVVEGLDGSLLITQGYSVGAPTITISPGAKSVLPNGTIVFTASVPSSWSATGGSLVVAGDNLSATWTAPAVVGNYNITAEDLADPGNQAVGVGVVATASGSVVRAPGAGSAVDARNPGAYRH